MKITWFGHSCFLFEDRNGMTLLTDPFDPKGGGGMLGYEMPDVSADYVLVSHQHFDHNAVGLIKGTPIVIDKCGLIEYPGLQVRGIEGSHDDSGGSERGKTIMYRWEMEGLNLCHLGDLGQNKLDREQLDSFGHIDILLIPTGGFFTIGPSEAVTVIKQLQPKIVIPMHYKTTAFPIVQYEIGDFLAKCQSLNAAILKEKNIIEIDALSTDKMTEIHIIQMSYYGGY